MKTAPSEWDREAATLFNPAAGARLLCGFRGDEPQWYRAAGWVSAAEERPIANIVNESGRVVAQWMHSRGARLVAESCQWRPRKLRVTNGQPTMEGHGILPNVYAIDTDDPATVGVMLAQVEGAWRRPAWISRDMSGEWVVESIADEESGLIRCIGQGATRGAALVDAMRSLARVRATP